MQFVGLRITKNTGVVFYQTLKYFFQLNHFSFPNKSFNLSPIQSTIWGKFISIAELLFTLAKSIGIALPVASIKFLEVNLSVFNKFTVSVGSFAVFWTDVERFPFNSSTRLKGSVIPEIVLVIELDTPEKIPENPEKTRVFFVFSDIG